MVEAINVQNSAKTPNLKKHIGIGALLTGTIGAIPNAFVGICSILQLKKGILTQDEFIAQQKEMIKEMPDGYVKETINNALQDVKSVYKVHQECVKGTLSALKKETLKATLSSAAMFGALGALLGGIVYVVKKHTENKQIPQTQQNQQMPQFEQFKQTLQAKQIQQ